MQKIQDGVCMQGECIAANCDVLCWLAQYIRELTADIFLPFHVLLISDPPKKLKNKNKNQDES